MQYIMKSSGYPAMTEGTIPTSDDTNVTKAKVESQMSSFGGFLNMTAPKTTGAIMDVPAKLTLANSTNSSLM